MEIERKAVLNDIAVLTGGTVISELIMDIDLESCYIRPIRNS